MIKDFVADWHDKGNEKSDTQKFWLDFLRFVLGIDTPSKIIDFEKGVELSHKSFIDGYIPITRIVIEQKSHNVNLDAPAKQSDGTLATPFEQAKRYHDWLPVSEQGRYIVVCNFREFRIHDLEHPHEKPEVILLRNLEREHYKLAFLVDEQGRSPKEVKETKLSVEAGAIVGKLYNALLQRYNNPNDTRSQHSLNVFCVRLVFLLYAENAGLFEKGQFTNYLKQRSIMARDALRKLFTVLNQKPEHRDTYLEPALQAFRYVNGGLFADCDIELPLLDGEPLRIILDEMSKFNWAEISPTIFGAVFESTLNPQTRHSGGMHYTSIQNIHKVINPLFLDALTLEADTLLALKPSGTRTRRLRTFQKKLASLQFFDAACGSGNFLTESYLSIRRLENRVIAELVGPQITFAFSKKETPIQVSIAQFYGIEINDFAVAVARTALWIAEAQMWEETAKITRLHEDFLPLKSEAIIIHANALRVDWHSIVTPNEKLYIMGNPPFLGYSLQDTEQKKDIQAVCVDENGNTYKAAGKLDYVAAWYYKASEFIAGTATRTAFVATNSITQGEQVGATFKPLHERFGIQVDFAHTPFTWSNEAMDTAHVHVVIIGFDTVQETGRLRRLYTPEGLLLVDNINFYLVPAPDVFVEPTSKAISEGVKPMRRGSQPTDNGNLILTRKKMLELVAENPIAEQFIRPFMMGADFIHRTPRYCLWLVDAKPDDILKCPKVAERVKAVQEFRRASKKSATQKKASTPTLFDEVVECNTHYIAVPKTSSEKRSYIPIDWLPPEVIPGDGLRIIPNATLYDFGVLTSRVHMAWMRRVCGRLEMRYSYSNTIVYNTFAWPKPTTEQRMHIERTAQGILDARAKYPDSTFAALYNDTFMPPALRKAHELNDAAVCEAYGWPADLPEFDVVARLFELYQKLTASPAPSAH